MNPPLDSGRVRIRLTVNDGRVSAVKVSCERPDVAQLLRGRATRQTVRMVGLMFALCGEAQTQAAELALSAAHGNTHAPAIDTKVQREALREHLWRCLFDLPPLLGRSVLQQEFVLGARHIVQGQRDELNALFASPAIQSLRLHLNESNASYPSYRPNLLPKMDAQASLLVWSRLSHGLCRQPEWQGAAAETGALSRKHESSETPLSFISAHWQACLDELAEWASGHDAASCVGTVSAVPVASAVGRALVETARGLLMHEVVLDGDVITDYFIVSPTEWNFHPQGALHERLLGADARDREVLQQQVAQLVTTLGPCVPWELEWA